jgi:hypothetical protein
MKKYKKAVVNTGKEKLLIEEAITTDIEFSQLNMEFSIPKENSNKFINWVKTGGEGLTEKQVDKILNKNSVIIEVDNGKVQKRRHSRKRNRLD